MIGYLNCASPTSLPLTTKDFSLQPSLSTLTPPLTRPPHPSPNHPFSPPSPPSPFPRPPRTPPPPSPCLECPPPSPWHVTPLLSPRASFPAPRVLSPTACTCLYYRGSSHAFPDDQPQAYGVTSVFSSCAKSLLLVGDSGSLFPQGNVASTLMVAPTITQHFRLALQTFGFQSGWYLFSAHSVRVQRFFSLCSICMLGACLSSLLSSLCTNMWRRSRAPCSCLNCHFRGASRAVSSATHRR
jgi:hypothetical protein